MICSNLACPGQALFLQSYCPWSVSKAGELNELRSPALDTDPALDTSLARLPLMQIMGDNSAKTKLVKDIQIVLKLK